MIYKSLNMLIVAVVASFSIGCGGEDDTSSTASAPSLSNPKTGVFVDSAVSGLSYLCSSGVKGVTNAKGEFTCNVDDNVTFYLGATKLGEAVVADEITPYTLYPKNEEYALNLAQLLQTVDTDSNPSNGISISDDTLKRLENVTFDINSTDFDKEIMLSPLGFIIVDTAAKIHLDETMTTLNLTKPVYVNELNVTNIISSGTNTPTTQATSTSAPKLAGFSGSIVENSASGAIVGNLPIVSQGASAISAINLSGVEHEKFQVATSGAISVASGAVLDFETKKKYDLSAVAINDDGTSASVVVTINILDIVVESGSVTPAAPVVVDVPTLSNFVGTIAENSNSGSVVGNMPIVNPGTSGITTITLSGTGSSNFVVAVNGQITLSSTANIDYETTTSYSLTAIATNSSGNSSSVTVSITVINLVD